MSEVHKKLTEGKVVTFRISVDNGQVSDDPFLTGLSFTFEVTPDIIDGTTELFMNNQRSYIDGKPKDIAIALRAAAKEIEKYFNV